MPDQPQFPWRDIPALREFVIHRVTQMRATPGMWAITREGFGMQLVVYLELATGLPSSLCTQVVLGRDGTRATVIADMAEDAWAQERCDLVLERLRAAQ